MKEKITIIVPVYNVEDYLGRCIDSILAQAYQNLQIILIDDGSTDASGDICDSFVQKDERVQVIHKINGGATSARKAGLAKAEGDYIAFVDADDYIEPNMYEELLEYLVSTNSDFVQAGYIEESEFSGHTVYLPDEEKVFSSFNKADIISKYVLEYGESGIATVALWSKLYRRELIIECYGKVPDDLILGEDVLSVCYCIFNSHTFAIKKSAYYHYAFRTDSLSCRNGDTIIFSRIGDLHRHLRHIFKEYGCFEQLRERQDDYLIRVISAYLMPLGRARGVFDISLYYYPKLDEVLGKRIVIYGAGYVGQDYYTQFRKYVSCEVVALMDTYPERCSLEYIEVLGPKELAALEFDIVIIAVLNQNVMEEIRNSLLISGVSEHQIIWKKPELMVKI